MHCSDFIRDMKTKLLVVLTLLLVISGCETVDGPKGLPPGQLYGEVYDKGDLKDILKDIRNSSTKKALTLRLKATDIALSLSLLEQAKEILYQVNEADTRGLSNLQFRLLNARINLKENQPVAAIEWLNTQNLDQLGTNPFLQINWGRAKSEAFLATQKFIPSARERIYYDGLLDLDRRKINHERILQTLTTLPGKELLNEAGKKKGVTQEFRGWLLLAALTKKHQFDPFRQFDELRIWQRKWPKHPASVEPPESLILLEKVVTDRPNHIALLLPLQGKIGQAGRAVRDGILASHFHFIQNHEKFPSISIIDTTDVSMEFAYELAMARGVDFIIGPLRRDKVRELERSVSLSVPVLALNRIKGGSPNPDLFQFGLAPEDEVIQLVDQASREGYRHSLVIAPDTEWGNRNLETFKSHWEKSGGTLAGYTIYDKPEDYSQQIKELLKVNSSQARAALLKRTLAEEFEFNPRRRQDVDFIFLLGNSSQAKSINPAIGFHYADDVPVYSTSHIHDTSNSRKDNMDMNRVRFNEIPFNLTKKMKIQQKVLKRWPSAQGRLAPLYALGIDAYHIYPRLQLMKLVPEERTYGMTGVLSLDSGNIIRRRLLWAQFKDGKAVSLPTIIDSPSFQ